MKIFFLRVGIVVLSSILPTLHAYKIGLCIVATGRYDTYATQLIESARKYFCKKHQVTYFVFTDGFVPVAQDTVVIYQKRLGWPYDTLMRCAIYAEHADQLCDMDYIFATDADMLFVSKVGDEILGDRVGTQHPGFVGKVGTYDRNKISTAYVKPNEGKYYFAGGFYGGSREEFIRINHIMSLNIERDLQRDYIAIWHDESHLNRYFIDNPPTLVLSPSYCYPGSWDIPYKKKLVALVKDHTQMRA